MDRRQFLAKLAQFGGAAAVGGLIACDRVARPDAGANQNGKGAGNHRNNQTNNANQANPDPALQTAVALVYSTNRAEGTHRAMELLERDFRGQRLFLKPNFNSADPAPGSTHNDVLEAMVRHFQTQRVHSITVGDRSGMGQTREVMRQKQIFAMGEEFNFQTLVFDELARDQWRIIDEADHHWERGFAMPLQVLEAEAYVQTCLLKTHRFGGHFTMALKNNVGLAARTLPDDPYNYMNELHDSPHQRRMIAELNTAVNHDLILLDAVEAFYEEGPEAGPVANINVIVAGTDPVAVDAVGVALLRRHGTTPEVSRGPIYELEQIARAAELGVGTANVENIEFLTDDARSLQVVDEITALLQEG